MPLPRRIIDRFLAGFLTVDKESCWPWQLGVFSTGYGYITDGHKKLYAHRVSYQLAYTTPPGNLCVLHKCDNRPCVNPKHLFLGTRKDNSADMVTKGRHLINRPKEDRSGPRLHPESMPRGELHCRHKLTERKVIYIRTKYLPGCSVNGARALARKYGVDVATILRVVKRVSWKHVI